MHGIFSAFNSLGETFEYFWMTPCLTCRRKSSCMSVVRGIVCDDVDCSIRV